MKACLKYLIAFLFLSYFDLLAQQPLIIDHTCTDLSKIPVSYIQTAKQNLRIGYGHTSHGSQLVTGLEALKSLGSDYHFTKSNYVTQPGIFLNDYWGNAAGVQDLGSDGNLAWRDATIQLLNLSNNDRNVVMWSWCGGVSWTNAAGIQAYLDAMNQLEINYPNVKFVYMTGHLDGTGVNGNLNQRNEQIRNYCRTNNKILFDFADIESYDPDLQTNYMILKANDGCFYDSDGNGSLDMNWATNWINGHSSNQLAQLASNCDECAHSEKLNCIQKGIAYWWMLARIAGWNGVVSDNNDQQNSLPKDFSLTQNFPNPFNPFTTISYALPVNSKVLLTVFDAIGNELSVLVNEEKSAGQHSVEFNASNLASGLYFYRIQAGNFNQTRKMILLK